MVCNAFNLKKKHFVLCLDTPFVLLLPFKENNYKKKVWCEYEIIIVHIN